MIGIAHHDTKEWDCPVSRTFAQPRKSCRGAACPVWRWLPIDRTTPEWVAAVQKAAEELGDKSGPKSKAAKHVVENREKYGLPTEPTHGFCGIGPKPEV